jgi:hypothetical protein
MKKAPPKLRGIKPRVVAAIFGNAEVHLAVHLRAMLGRWEFAESHPIGHAARMACVADLKALVTCPRCRMMPRSNQDLADRYCRRCRGAFDHLLRKKLRRLAPLQAPTERQ